MSTKNDAQEGNDWPLGRIFDPIFLFLISAIWLLGGTLIAQMWWHVDSSLKIIWAFGLVFWLLISPLLLATILLFVSMIFWLKAIPGSIQLCQTSKVLINTWWIPFKWVGLPPPQLINQIQTILLTGHGRFAESDLIARQALANLNKKYIETAAAIRPLATAAEAAEWNGRYEDAQLFYQKALNLAIGSTNLVKIAIANKDFANFYRRMEKFENAEKYFQNSLSASNKDKYLIESLKDIDTGFIHCEMADLELRRGDLVKAKNYLEVSKLSIVDVGGGILLMNWLRMNAELLIKEGALESARDNFTKAKAIFLKSASHLKLQKLRMIQLEALLVDAEKDYKKSNALFEEYLTLSRKLFVPDHMTFVMILRQYAESLAAQGLTTESGQMHQQSDEIKQRCYAQLSG